MRTEKNEYGKKCEEWCPGRTGMIGLNPESMTLGREVRGTLVDP